MKATSSRRSAAIDQASAALESILSALIRYQKYKHPGMLKRLPPSEYFHNLNQPGGSFEVIGRQGSKGFNKLSDAFFMFHPQMRGRVTDKEVVNLLKRFLARAISGRRLRTGESITGPSLMIISERYLRRYRLQTKNHVLPCIIPHAKDGGSFAVGPVLFYPTDVFFEKYDDAIKETLDRTERHWLERERLQILDQRSIHGLTPNEAWPRKAIHDAALRWVGDFRSILSTYPWITVVEIQFCTKEMAQERAQLAVETALNALRLVFGTEHGHSMRRGGGFRLETRTVAATIDLRDGLSIRYSQTWESAGLPDDWTQHLLHPDIVPIIDTLGSLITHIAKGGVLPPLYQRVVDALSWYGEAVAEPQEHTRILRCMSSLERLLVTGPGRTEQTVKRRGILLCSIGEPEKRVYWEQQFTRLYNVRHGIVHGRLSPIDKSVLRAAALADLVVGRCLWHGVFWAAYIAKRNHLMSAGELHGWYEKELEQFCRNLQGE